MFGNYLGCLEKCLLLKKKHFWATFGKIGLLLIVTSGHFERIVETAQ